MFTPQQFSTLAAAAWSGPAASRFATIGHYSNEAGDYTTTSYCVSYHPHGASGPCYQGSQPCPFAAVQAALDKAATAGVLPVAAIVAGTAIVQQAAAAFANAPAPHGPAACTATPATGPRHFATSPAAIKCAACGCTATTDPFGVGCDCVWATMRQPVCAHA